MTNPAVRSRSKVIDTWAAEALAAGTHYGPSVEVPRGAEDIDFTSEMTVLDETSGDEDYTFFVQHRNSSEHAWVTFLSFTKVVGDIGVDETQYEQKPAASDAPGTKVKRFVRSGVLTAGTSPIATGNIRMGYSLPRGPGLEHQPNYQGG